ncbi:MAG: hypothetical protein LGR52_15805 [Candidatus Thiosymbion ectosymbiont of Robbea hypermnestra]|nr:hypothetical protein [Candidatus Thiosymbion ectosymbiont of Robbea hypermnestra]
MNVYFLVEGKTEGKVYPKWISYLAPTLKRVDFPADVQNNNYYLISGGGFPSILDNHLVDSVADIQASGRYDYLVLVIDTDALSAGQKRLEIDEFLHSKKKKLNMQGFEFVVIPQVVCMETWFLGNRKIYARNPSSQEVAEFSRYYDVSQLDPEQMPKPLDFDGTIGGYHYQYLKGMMAEKNIRYSKSNPKEVGRRYYINDLQSRLDESAGCLQSMGLLFDFLSKLESA